MKKILFVSYRCPPMHCIGTLRVAKMLKYLLEFGYQPYILGAGLKKDRDPYIFKPKYFDPFQFGKRGRDIIRKTFKEDSYHNNKNVNVEREIKKCNKPRGLWPLSEVRMPDKYMFWIWPAIRLGKHLLKTEKFDIIYSSSGPASSAIVASMLQRYSHLPWVAEFRDLWSNNHIDLRKPIIHKFDSWLEDKVLKNCNVLVTVSESLKECLEKKHGKLTYVVYNGYDEDDYPKRENLTKKLTITYTGKIHPEKQDPAPLFEAIANLFKDKKITPDILQVRFYGPEQEITKALVQKYGIKDYVHLGGVVSYEESLSRQCESWILLFLEWNDPLVKGVLTGKFFEYLGAKRPILCIGYNEGSIGKILEETGAGKILNSPGDIERFLIWCVGEYKKGNNLLGFIMNDSVLNYNRRKAAENLSKVFSSLI